MTFFLPCFFCVIPWLRKRSSNRLFVPCEQFQVNRFGQSKPHLYLNGKRWSTMTPKPIKPIEFLEPIDQSADTIIQDLHRIRKMLSDRFQGDLSAIVEDARKRQAASGRRIIERGELSSNRPRAKR